MLLSSSADGLTQEQQELIQIMQTGVKSMNHLIADALSLSRLESGNFPIDPAVVSLPGVVDQALRMVWTTPRPSRLATPSCADAPMVGSVHASLEVRLP